MANILRKALTRILNITVYSSNTIVSNRVSMFYSLNKLVADLVSLHIMVSPVRSKEIILLEYHTPLYPIWT
jgi:hypothetical protein